MERKFKCIRTGKNLGDYKLGDIIDYDTYCILIKTNSPRQIIKMFQEIPPEGMTVEEQKELDQVRKDLSDFFRESDRVLNGIELERIYISKELYLILKSMSEALGMSINDYIDKSLDELWDLTH